MTGSILSTGSPYVAITTATTTQVKTKKGVLRRITFVKPVASSTVKLIDNTAGSTVNIGTITNTTDVKPYYLEFNLKFDAGLRIITDQADFIVVTYD